MQIAFRDLPVLDNAGSTRNFELLQAALNPVWIKPAFLNGWENFEAARNAEFVRDLTGFVHLRGAIKKGESNKTAFSLPAGYRPGPSKEVFIVFASNEVPAIVVVENTGAVVPINIAPSEVKTYCFLDGITFRAER